MIRETATGARDLTDDRRYGYDPLRRLVAVSDRGTKPLSFGYDPVGNRTATLRDGRLAEQASFDAADQLSTLTGANGKLEASFSYDPNGNLTERRSSQATAFTYDAADRLLAAGPAGRESRFAYSGDGDLVREECPAQAPSPARTLEHTLDTAGPLSQILTTSDGSASASFLYGQGRIAAFTASEDRFFANDLRQSPRLATDERGPDRGGGMGRRPNACTNE